MKNLYQVLDGKVFEDKFLAEAYEAKLLKGAEGRIKILEQLPVFKNFKEGDILDVAHGFDGAGNSSKHDKLEGSKEKVMMHIAVNLKYWNIGNQVEIFVWKNDIIKL